MLKQGDAVESNVLWGGAEVCRLILLPVLFSVLANGGYLASDLGVVCIWIACWNTLDV